METPTLQANGKQTGRPLGLTVHPAATACSITTAAGPSLPAGIPDPQFTVSEQARREAFASLDHAHHQVIAAETAELVGILHAAQLWAVTCDQIDASIERVARTEKLRAYGHDGTPHIGEFLALEIGPLLGISAHTAICRIADALDLAYRFPKTLSQVLMGTIRVWQALKASHRCNDLPLAAALEVDTQLADALKTLPFSMVMKRLDEWIIAADPALAAQRAETKRKARFIRISPIEDGHVTIHGILDATDGILFNTILNKVAAILPKNPDVDSFTDHDLRRTQALGVICRHHQTQTSNRASDSPGRSRTGWPTGTTAPGHQEFEHPGPRDVGQASHGSAYRSQPEWASCVGNSATKQNNEEQAQLSHAAFANGGDKSTSTPTHTLIIHINADDLALRTGPMGTASMTGQQTRNDTPDQNTGLDDRHLICHQPHLPPVGVARIEDWGPLLTSQLPEFLKGTKVVVRPIIDPAQIEPTDAYQTPDKMRFAIEQRNPTDVFPYGTAAAKHCDLDHTAPYIRGRNAPAGQTSPGNLGPLSRTAHRAKTFGGWQLHQPTPATTPGPQNSATNTRSHPQEPAAPNSIDGMNGFTLDELLELEHAGWRSLCESRGGTFYGKLMTPDALFILVNGMTMTREAVANSLDGAPGWASYEITDAQLIQLGQDAAALTYRCTSSRPDLPEPFTAIMSSVYRRIDGQARLALYQQTTITH
ncbi:DUF4440 domain-containing protein [Propionimicrobium sp. PCR01-08-3]|uniref:DUF4440 domain-containing protein n=1 Tax=Propionimicrobium sp. PCR01-08-3 TaxID=3052086 RepID=UPI00255D0AB4|nr:DUF4440 domain-containing protein [Propionimicrobium sp. PCR01-08-3]WIY82429.1 DUF222 domain-containing protein [Propionimicrobium sp. PCR01-08-3]